MSLRGLSGVLSGVLLWLCASSAWSQDSAAPARAPVPLQAPSEVSTGTGFFVSTEGHLITAHHVVREREQVWVRWGVPSRVLKASVLQRDPQWDLALLKVEATSEALNLAKWDEVPMGLEAYVLGFPLPNLQGRTLKITQGLLSGEAKSVKGRPLFALTAAVQTGNSGGPVLSPDGLVLGMVHSKLDALKVAEKTRDLPQNVNFALSADVLAAFMASAGLPARVVSPSLITSLRPYQLMRMGQNAVVMVISAQKSGNIAPPATPQQEP